MLFMSRVQSNNFYSTCNTPANLSDTPDQINTVNATPNTLPQPTNDGFAHKQISGSEGKTWNIIQERKQMNVGVCV